MGRIFRKPILLREFDEPEPDYRADKIKREAYWKRACHADFPRETKHLRFPLYDDWESTYSELNYEKKQAQLAKEKELEKERKNRERELNKRLKRKSGVRSGWVMAIRYLFNGDAAIHSEHKNMPMWYDHVNSKDYKGLNEFHLWTKDGRYLRCIVNEQWGCDDIEDNTDVISGKTNALYYPFTLGYEVCAKSRGREDEIFNVSIRIGVYYNDVNVEEIHTDNDNVDIDRSIMSLDKDIKKKCMETYKKLILDDKIYI